MTTLVRPLLIAFVGIRLAAAAEVPAGPLAIGVADDLTLHDEARGKNLPYKVSFPDADGPYPVIVFSHGFGGNKDAFVAISRHWASHGYGSPKAVGPASRSR